MKLRLYSVFDKKVEAFLPPLCFRSEGEALRSFGDACTSHPDFSKHKGDYAFAFLGLFDDNLGLFEPLTAPTIVADGLTIVKLMEEASGNA